MTYIKWTRKLIDEYLNDKMKSRGLMPDEFEFVSSYLQKIKPEIIIDVGTFLGISGYIIGTSSPNLKQMYAIENIDDISFVPYGNPPIPKSEYGKFLPKDAIFKTNGYHKDLLPILENHKDDIVFVFLDAKKQTEGVLDEISLCYQGKAKYIGLHDTSIWYRKPRRAVKRAIQLGWYKLIDEINVENTGEKRKGVTLLELNV